MKSIKIGLLHSETGTMALSEVALLEAALLAADEINAKGGILGHKLKCIIEDGASDPGVFAEKAEKMIVQDQVSAIFGGWNSHTRKSVKQVVEKHNVLFWYPMQYEGFEQSDHIFYTGCCINQQVLPTINWGIEQGWRKYFLLGSDYIYPIMANKLIRAELETHGCEIQQECYVPLGHAGFEKIIDAVKTHKPDAIINTLNGDSNLHFFKQLKCAGLSSDDVPVMSTSIAEHECRQIGSSVNGHYACWTYFQQLENSANQAFVNKFRKRYGEHRVVSDPIAMAYSQLFMWKQIAERAGSFNIDCIREKAVGQTFSTPLGMIAMRKNQHVTKKVYIGKMSNSRNFDIVWRADDYIEPLPWLGMEELRKAPFSLMKNLFGQFTDRSASLELQISEHTHELQQKNSEYTKLNQHLLEVNDDLSKANQALKAGEEWLSILFDKAAESIFVCKLDGQFVKVNEEACRALGYTKNELLQQNILNVDQKVKAKKNIDELVALLTPSVPLTIESTFIRKDKSVFPVEATITWINTPAEPCVQVLARDISKRCQMEAALRKSEQYYRTLFENMSAGVVVYTAVDGGNDFLISDINTAGEQYSSVKRNDVIGKRVTDVFPAVKDIGLLDCLKQSYLTGEPKLLPLTEYCDDRISEWVENQVFRLPSGEVVAIYEDRTEQFKLEQHIQQTERMKSIGLLAGGIAHDFNNILTPIICFSEMSLEEVAEDSRLYKNLTKILESSGRAKKLVGQILAFSRQRSESKGPLAIRPIIEEVEELLRATLPSSITINSYYTDETRPVFGNATKVHEVVMNLCTNAAFAMNEKGVLEIRQDEVRLENDITGQLGNIKPGIYSVITVTDDGCGMSTEVLAHIFEPFFTTKAVGEGTGMGLAVIFGIIQDHGGDITVESRLGAGTTFQVFLPTVNKSLVDDHKKNEPVPNGTERILFIDDEEVLNDIINDMLTGLGYSVTTMSDSVEALELFRTDPERFDMVITDQTMPGLTGVELSEEVMNIKPEMPVILCTGYSKFADEEKANEIGVKGFFMKPFHRTELALEIRRIFDDRRE